MRSELHLKISKYLHKAKILHLATSTRDGQPWVSNVWFVADDDFNIYWISSTTRRHSHEITENQKVAASICSVREPSESDMGGLQLEGIASEVTNPLEIAKALKLYAARGIFTVSQVKKFMADLHYPHRFYKIMPSTIAFFGDTKEEYKVK